MRRVYRVMEREMICSEHGALCFIEACRRDRAKVRKAKQNRLIAACDAYAKKQSRISTDGP